MSEENYITVKVVFDVCPGLQDFVNGRQFCFYTQPDRHVVAVVEGESQPFGTGLLAGTHAPVDISDTLNAELGVSEAEHVRLVCDSMRKAERLGEIKEE